MKEYVKMELINAIKSWLFGKNSKIGKSLGKGRIYLH